MKNNGRFSKSISAEGSVSIRVSVTFVWLAVGRPCTRHAYLCIVPLSDTVPGTGTAILKS